MPADRVIGASPQGSEPRARGGPGGDGIPRRQVYLQGGEVFVSAEPASVATILGSCVSVCLYDPVAGVGGMNHYLLPFAVEREGALRFGNVAITTLLERTLAAGARRLGLQAKVFGGSGAFHDSRRNGRHLGHDNVEVALRALEAEGIPLVQSDVGGRQGRKVICHLDDGTAWVRRL